MKVFFRASTAAAVPVASSSITADYALAEDRRRRTEPASGASAAPLPWSRQAALVSAAGLIGADMVALLTAAGLVVAFRDFIWGAVPHPLGILETGAAWIILRLGAGIYPGFGLSPVEELRLCTTTTTVAAMVHAAALFSLQATAVSRFSVLVTWSVLVVVSGLFRAETKHILIRRRQFGAPVIIGGTGETGSRLVDELRANQALGLVPVAFFDDDPATHRAVVRGVPVLGSLRQALDLPRSHHIRYAIIAIPALTGKDLAHIARLLSTRYLSIAVVEDLAGLVDLSLRARSFGTSLALEVRNNLLDPINLRLKRLFDLLVAVPLAFLTLPLVLGAGLLVKLISPGSAFFRQEREGLGGRRIRVWKVRTMVPDASTVLARYLVAHPEAQREWSRHMKLRQDPRVIPLVGHFLRRFSIDELPQLWNVVRGEMSLVGPRPFPEYHLAQFPHEFRRLRRQTVPGMTGLWQVTCRSGGDLRDQERIDSYYVRNWSLWTDIWILLSTARAVFAGRGAH